MAKSRAAARPSMADVARIANVSTQTVSRYFTGVGYVGADTRGRIAEAIADLGYIPNQTARNLRTQRSNTIGVLSMGSLNYGSSGVLTGLALAAREANVTLTIAQLDLSFEAKDWEAEAQRALDHFASMRVDGIVLSTPIAGADRLLADIDASIPVFTVSELPWSQEPSLDPLSYSAGLDATRHLIGLGHTAILHVAGPATRNQAIERERGYRDAMAEAGLVPQVLTGATDWTPAFGFRAGEIAEPADFTGVFASNDEIALGFLSAMEARGLRSPDDFSIVGVDDMPTAAYFSPPLTTMRVDFREIGMATFRMLHEQVLTGQHTDHYTLDPELIVRRSTDAPRPGTRAGSAASAGSTV